MKKLFFVAFLILLASPLEAKTKAEKPSDRAILHNNTQTLKRLIMSIKRPHSQSTPTW